MSCMMGDYLANKLNDHVTGVAVYTPPTQIKVSLCTAKGTIAQCCANTNFTECTGGGYAQVNVGVGSTNWNASGTTSPRLSDNKLAVSFGTPSADWGTVVAWRLLDQSGNLLWWGDESPSKSCPAYAAVSSAIGAITMALPQGT